MVVWAIPWLRVLWHWHTCCPMPMALAHLLSNAYMGNALAAISTVVILAGLGYWSIHWQGKNWNTSSNAATIKNETRII